MDGNIERAEAKREKKKKKDKNRSSQQWVGIQNVCLHMLWTPSLPGKNGNIFKRNVNKSLSVR